MDAFNELVSSFTSMFDWNDSTLSGCVDIIAVQHPDGSIRSTPFHVRFGKLKVIRSKEQILKIHVNDKETGLTMTLGEAGEGFFEEDESDPLNNFSNDLKSPNASRSPIVLPDDRTNQANQGQGQFFGSLLNKIEASSPEEAGQKYGGMKNLLGLGNGKTSAETKFENDQPSQINSEAVYSESGRLIKKRLRPTSNMLKSLKLKMGLNTITYVVETDLQGTQTVEGHIYLWPSNAKIVVSDVDGTITKSDFLGHVMPMFGLDWSQPGIAPLYTNVKRNGYYMLYLSSRPVGRSQVTKDFLNSVNQDGKTLPEGPLVLSPDQLLDSVKREVIFKRPELFKMATLKDLRKLFPENHNPFHAGFGNRETDAISYRSVGISMENIFIVDPDGKIIQYHTDTAKSYSIINASVKEIFPLITKLKEQTPNEKVDFFSFREANTKASSGNTGKLAG